jgi:CBS domain-containing protein
MKVRNVMTTAVSACRRHDDLGRATQIMWERNCGIVPVLDEAGVLVGVITDRDICIASATRHVPPGTLVVGDVMSHPVHACLPDDPVETALGIMRRFKVHRIPVVDAEGHLKGILSLDDLVLAFHANRHAPMAQLVETIAAVCAHAAPPVLAT